MEYEYDGLEEYGGRVLWGRITFFAAALLLMFFVGRCTSSAGVPEADAVKLRDQVAQLSEQNTRLNDQLAAAQANANNPLVDATETEDQDQDRRTAADADEDEDDSRQSSRRSSSSDDTGSDSRETSQRSSRTVELPAGSTTYIVEEGDTLNSIAKRFYGDERKYPLIARANNLTRGNVLVIGQKLIIPPDPDEQ